MSAGRRHRRAMARDTPIPTHIAEAARRASCPDCSSEIRVKLDTGGVWHTSIAHDDNCPQLAWRERHGATTQFALVAAPGKTISGALVAEFVEAVGSQPGVTGVRVGTESALSWQERQDIDDLMGHEGTG